MNKDRILELMARKLSGEATPEELRELQDHLSADAAAGERSKVLDQFWSRRDDEAHPSVEENIRKVLGGLKHPETVVRMDQPARRTSRWLKVAAAVLIVLGAGTGVYVSRRDNSDGATMASLQEKRN